MIITFVNLLLLKPMTIHILLSTYNGQQHLKQQIESIFQQTYQDWRLVIRDDSSWF
jgi:rhamnosyltransferase